MIPAQQLQADLLNAKNKQGFEDWLSKRSVALSDVERDWIKDYALTNFGPGALTNSMNLDKTLGVLKAAQRLTEDSNQQGTALLDGFIRKSLPLPAYFDYDEDREGPNWVKVRTRWKSERDAGRVFSVQDCINWVWETEYELGAWRWVHSDTQVADALLKAGRSGDSTLIQYGKVDGHLVPIDGKLVGKFGLDACRRAFALLDKRNNKSHDVHSPSVIEQAAQAVSKNPEAQLQVAKELIVIIQGHRCGSWAQTEREREILWAVAQRYVAFNDEKTKAAAKGYLHTYELSGTLDEGVFQCLEDLKAAKKKL